MDRLSYENFYINEIEPFERDFPGIARLLKVWPMGHEDFKNFRELVNLDKHALLISMMYVARYAVVTDERTTNLKNYAFRFLHTQLLVNSAENPEGYAYLRSGVLGFLEPSAAATVRALEIIEKIEEGRCELDRIMQNAAQEFPPPGLR